jgi:hypothetical protein
VINFIFFSLRHPRKKVPKDFLILFSEKGTVEVLFDLCGKSIVIEHVCSFGGRTYIRGKEKPFMTFFLSQIS